MLLVLIGNVQIGLDAPARFGSIITTINTRSRDKDKRSGVTPASLLLIIISCPGLSKKWHSTNFQSIPHFIYTFSPTLKYSSSCWVIIQNQVYDVTEFLFVCFFLQHLSPSFLYSPLHKEHPGGAEIILKYAGRDATSVYKPIHPLDALEKNLPLSKHLGPLTDKAIQIVAQDQQAVHKTRDALRVEHARKRMPPLNRILNLKDMEVRKMPLNLPLITILHLVPFAHRM